MRVDYRELPVPERLRSHFACAWHLEDSAPPPGVQTIYPDGCCEIIVHRGAPPRSWDEAGGWHDQATTLFASQHLRPVRLQATGPIDCVGVRLQPEASSMLGRVALVTDRILDLSAVDGALSRALIQSADTFIAGNAIAWWQVLGERASRAPVDAAVSTAVLRLRENHGATRIESLARSAGLSLRSLQARFRAHVGLTPKEFGRMMRLRATLTALDEGDGSVADVAADLGFADQAHAARELKRTTGLAPARLRAALRADRNGDAAVQLAAAFVRGQSR